MNITTLQAIGLSKCITSQSAEDRSKGQIVDKLLQTAGDSQNSSWLSDPSPPYPEQSHPHPSFSELFSWASIAANITLLYRQCKKILDLVLLEHREYVFSAAKVNKAELNAHFHRHHLLNTRSSSAIDPGFRVILVELENIDALFGSVKRKEQQRYANGY